MNRDRLTKDLAMVDRDIARDAENIRKQQEVVAELTALGRASLVIEARELLAKFQTLQRMDVDRRARLARELEEFDNWEDSRARPNDQCNAGGGA